MIESRNCCGGAVVFLLAALGFAAPLHAAERKFMVGNFDEVAVEGDARVTVITGRSVAAMAQGEPVDLDRVQLDRTGDRLRVRMTKPVGGSASSFRPSQPVRIFVSAPSLERAELRGNGALTVDRLEGRDARLTVFGSGSVEVGDVAAERLTVTLVGNGLVSVAGGNAELARLDLNGAGSLEAEGLEVDDLELRHSGPATTLITARRKADIVNNGAGSIIVGGKADCFVRRAGSGEVSCGGE